MHFKSIATFLAKSANEKKSVRSTKGGICGVRTQRQSHHTGHPVETSGCGHAMFGFRRAPDELQLQHERGGAYWQTKALQTSRLSPNSHLFANCATTAKRRSAVLSTVRKV